MAFPRMKRRRAVVSIFIVLYVAGYAVMRSQQLLVHGVSFETTDGGKRYHHFVRIADFGPSVVVLTGRTWDARLTLAEWSYWMFLPLRFVEACGWHLVPKNYGI